MSNICWHHWIDLNGEFCAKCGIDKPESDEIPIGWELINLTESERDELCKSADAGDTETAEKVVDGAYERLFRKV